MIDDAQRTPLVDQVFVGTHINTQAHTIPPFITRTCARTALTELRHACTVPPARGAAHLRTRSSDQPLW